MVITILLTTMISITLILLPTIIVLAMSILLFPLAAMIAIAANFLSSC
jgi:hypothetical protein